jgi:hypothetical protein
MIDFCSIVHGLVALFKNNVLEIGLYLRPQVKAYSQGNGPIRHVETCPDFFFLHCKSTHKKIHCQNSSC